MQIYWNNNSNNDNNNKEQNKTKNSLRKELYRVVFLILTVKLLYQFLPENVLFYHDLHTVNNTKKARKEKKVVEYRSCWWIHLSCFKKMSRRPKKNWAQVIFFYQSPKWRLTNFNIFVVSNCIMNENGLWNGDCLLRYVKKHCNGIPRCIWLYCCTICRQEFWNLFTWHWHGKVVAFYHEVYTHGKRLQLSFLDSHSFSSQKITTSHSVADLTVCFLSG